MSSGVAAALGRRDYLVPCVHPNNDAIGEMTGVPTSKSCAFREGWSGACAMEDVRPKSSRRGFLPWTGGATRLKVNTVRHEPVRSPGPSLKYRSVPGRGPRRPNSHKGNWLDRHAAGITNEFLPEDCPRLSVSSCSR